MTCPAQVPQRDAVVARASNPRNNYYAILGLRRNASTEEIQRAYRRDVKLIHPDKNHGLTEKEKQGLIKAFERINQAYKVLSDPVQRGSYDQCPPRVEQRPHYQSTVENISPVASSIFEIFNDVFGTKSAMRTVVRNNPVLLPVWNAAERGVPYLPTKDEVAQIQSAAGKNPEGVWQVLQHCLSAVLVEAGRSGDIKSASQALAFINQIYTSGATDKDTKHLLQKSIEKALSSDDPTQVVALPELLTNARQAGLALELSEVFHPFTGWDSPAFAVAAVSVLYKATKLDSPSFTKFIHSEEVRTYIGRWCDSLENEILKTQGEELRSIWTAVEQGHWLRGATKEQWMGSFCRRLQGAVRYRWQWSAVSSEWLADESPLMLEDRRSLLVGVVNRMNSEELIALHSKINPIAKKLGVGSADLVPAADAWLRSNTLWGRGSPSEMSGMLELLGEQAISTAAVSRLREGSTRDFYYGWDRFDSYLSLASPSDRDALWADPTFCSRFGSRLLKLLEDYKSQRGDTASEALKLVALVPDSMKLDEESRKAFGKNLFALSCVYREQPIFDGCARLGVAPASKLRALWYRMNRGT